jgi:hypothetical protein
MGGCSRVWMQPAQRGLGRRWCARTPVTVEGPERRSVTVHTMARGWGKRGKGRQAQRVAEGGLGKRSGAPLRGVRGNCV